MVLIVYGCIAAASMFMAIYSLGQTNWAVWHKNDLNVSVLSHGGCLILQHAHVHYGKETPVKWQTDRGTIPSHILDFRQDADSFWTKIGMVSTVTTVPMDRGEHRSAIQFELARLSARTIYIPYWLLLVMLIALILRSLYKTYSAKGQSDASRNRNASEVLKNSA
jgi:hypothetical protein